MEVDLNMEVKNNKGIEMKSEKGIKIGFSEEVIKFLEKHRIPYEEYTIIHLPEVKEEKDNHSPLVEIDKDIYNKFKKITEITGIQIEKIINTELDDAITCFIRDDPFSFLDRYIGLENIENPMTFIYKMKEIAEIPDDLIEYLEKIEEPLKHINPLKWYKLNKESK